MRSGNREKGAFWFSAPDSSIESDEKFEKSQETHALSRQKTSKGNPKMKQKVIYFSKKKFTSF